MTEVDAQILTEDLVLYAMRKRNKDWKRILLNIEDDDPFIKRVFTPEIGKTVLHFAKQESWSYMDAVDQLLQELRKHKKYYYGKLLYCLENVGKEYLDWDRKDTLFSYCAMIVEVCCYFHENGCKESIESAILAGGMSINEKLRLSTETDPERYHRYAVEYNRIYNETFLTDEPSLALECISSLGK